MTEYETPPTDDEDSMPYRAPDRRIRIQMVFLAVALLVITLVLAFRAEANARDIRVGLWESCQAGADRTTAINPGRAALGNVLEHLIDADVTLSAAEKDAAKTVIQAGLMVPPVSCGLRP